MYIDYIIEIINTLFTHSEVVVISVLIAIGVLAKGWYNEHQKKHGKDYMRRRFGNWKF